MSFITIKGTELTAADRADVLRSYVHRFTAQHKPAWAAKPMPNGNTYPVQFASDSDWLANTFFAVRLNGRLDKRAQHCMSFPTWPQNPELRDSLLAAKIPASNPTI